ncbi:MAG: ATP-dependent RecD-like DNA helicase [Thermoflexaceae bacterium]|nr:ATP-dependent RecD-like DNA helicase [Thermoflexaceae bacterium]
MITLEGFIDNIIFRNEENGYTVFEVVADGEHHTCVGTFQFINEGEFIELTGNETIHPGYGEQIQIKTYEIKAPADEISMERYLGSGAIKGIGEALASRIVKHFGSDTFRIIEEEPEQLSKIKGISEKKALEIASQMMEKRDMRKAMMFLQDLGVSMNMAVKIYGQYGPSMYTIIKENPYRLADDISGIGFKIADEIAAKAGIRENSEYRIRSGIMYVLLQAVNNGHVYLPQEELVREAGELLGIKPEDFEKHIMDLAMDKKVVLKDLDGVHIVYASVYYYTELKVADKLKELNVKYDVPEIELDACIRNIEHELEIELDTMQRNAIREAAGNGLLVITGGPGTGKTTTINAIIRYFELEGMEIRLAAPTGRAAKRMKETTGYEAQTIHRMLELNGAPEDNKGISFERNESNPLEADVVIIDEMSMVDINLMHSLLRAVNVGTRLILVGDVNQLPSVGPGNVLKDIINSHCFNVVMLTKIFRQASESEIIVNAHKINDGEEVILNKYSRDFLFLRRDNANAIINAMITLVKEKLPDYVHADRMDIQIMSPMRKGPVGVERLNSVLQEYLNPADDTKNEKESGDGIFREGDKVMQIKNNYQMEWEIRGRFGIPKEKGLGVFNGDIGIIRHISNYAQEMTVEFEEGKFVTYDFKQLEELELAYAITIHKSQGSEYPAVVIPMLGGPKMLMTRNLLYTGVTRAKTCVCMVGIEDVFQQMIHNSSEQKRYSTLDVRIKEVCSWK